MDRSRHGVDDEILAQRGILNKHTVFFLKAEYK